MRQAAAKINDLAGDSVEDIGAKRVEANRKLGDGIDTSCHVAVPGARRSNWKEQTPLLK